MRALLICLLLVAFQGCTTLSGGSSTVVHHHHVLDGTPGTYRGLNYVPNVWVPPQLPNTRRKH